MEFHQETIDGLRAKKFTVGPVDVSQAGHLFISVNGVHMPIEYARDMNRGMVTLAEIRDHLARSSN